MIFVDEIYQQIAQGNQIIAPAGGYKLKGIFAGEKQRALEFVADAILDVLARRLLVLGDEPKVDDSQFGVVVILGVFVIGFVALPLFKSTILPNACD